MSLAYCSEVSYIRYFHILENIPFDYLLNLVFTAFSFKYVFYLKYSPEIFSLVFWFLSMKRSFQVMFKSLLETEYLDLEVFFCIEFDHTGNQTLIFGILVESVDPIHLISQSMPITMNK